MLQKLNDEFLIDTYLQAVELKVDLYFIMLLTDEINRRFCSNEKQLSYLNSLITQLNKSNQSNSNCKSSQGVNVEDMANLKRVLV